MVVDEDEDDDDTEEEDEDDAFEVWDGRVVSRRFDWEAWRMNTNDKKVTKFEKVSWKSATAQNNDHKSHKHFEANDKKQH